MADDFNPKSAGSDHQSMAGYWQMVDAILGGAAEMRRNASVYLPRFENETQKDYANRVAHAPFTNVYGDISRNLASKPFSKQLTVSEDAPDFIAGEVDAASNARSGGFVDNVDGRGNNLHVFAQESFKAAIDYGLDWIMVDYPNVDGENGDEVEPRPTRSRAEEQALGLRPFWLRIPANKVLAAYTAFEDGKEILCHVRIDETRVERDGFGEKTVERVRVIERVELPDDSYGPAKWQVWEKIAGEANGVAKWTVVEDGAYSIGVIPLVPIVLGKRVGSGFAIDPPLRDLAYMQVEEFQQESNLKETAKLTAFPMLVGEGVGDPGSDSNGQKIIIPVGPRAVLLAPPSQNGNGTFKFIEPSATSLTFLQTKLEAHRKEMRDLGMQPLTEANLTVVTTANVSRKASSAVQAWAIMFQDALEQCFEITGMWLKDETQTRVIIHTDFSIDMDDSGQPDTLLKAQGQGVLSKKTVQMEFKRRGILSDEFDPETEEEQLAEEQQGLEPEEAIDPVTGEPVEPSARPKVVATIN